MPYLSFLEIVALHGNCYLDRFIFFYLILFSMDSTQELRGLALQVDKILKEQLLKYGIEHTLAEVRIYDVRTTGVQGDARTYLYPAEIELRNDGKVVWDEKFSAELSTRITNEVNGINRVVYVFAKK